MSARLGVRGWRGPQRPTRPSARRPGSDASYSSRLVVLPVYARFLTFEGWQCVVWGIFFLLEASVDDMQGAVGRWAMLAMQAPRQQTHALSLTYLRQQTHALSLAHSRARRPMHDGLGTPANARRPRGAPDPCTPSKSHRPTRSALPSPDTPRPHPASSRLS